jgi:hypothetical protein
MLLKTDGGTMVEVAENGEAGREALRHGCWDLVVCDVDLRSVVEAESSRPPLRTAKAERRAERRPRPPVLL